jgi:hypothetical protein
MNTVLQGPVLLVWVAMSLAGWFILLQFEELVSRTWKQRIASAVLLVLIVMLLGRAVQAAYLPDSDHYYYCLAWSWWPWSGC